jgi:regulator of protease activity HflC (stomatin/prohibitin superfamily)
MTVVEALEQLDWVRRLAGDDEAAHSAEDAFHQAVLEAIARGEGDDPATLAGIALRTQDINFARWCA